LEEKKNPEDGEKEKWVSQKGEGNYQDNIPEPAAAVETFINAF